MSIDVNGEVVSDELDVLRAEQEIFTREIEKMVADVEAEPTNFVYIQELVEEIQINTPFKEVIKENLPILAEPSYELVRGPDGIPPNYMEKLDEPKSLLKKEPLSGDESPPIPAEPSYEKIRRPDNVPPNYIEKLDGPESLLKKEVSRRKEKPPVPAKPNKKMVRRPDGIPPNYIEKVDEPESFLKKEPLSEDESPPISAEPSYEKVRRPDNVPPNYIEQLDGPNSLLKKEVSRRKEKPPVPAKPNKKMVRRPDRVPPNYIEKGDEPESSLKKESSRRKEKPPVPTKPNKKIVRIPGDVPPNYIARVEEPERVLKKESSRRKDKPLIPVKPSKKTARRPTEAPPNYSKKVEQLERFKETVSDRRAEIQEKETLVTGKITELQRDLSITVKEREEVTEERNEWKYKCNKLEIELCESKQELKRKDELIYSFGSTQADLASTSKALADSNIHLQELLSDKKRIEDERKKTSAELELAKTKLRRCEEKLQELQSKEQVTTQEQEHLEKKLEKCKLVVDKLEKKEAELEEQFRKFQTEKEDFLKSQTLGRSVTDTLRPVTTVAEQAEGGGEQEVDSFSDDDDGVMSVPEERFESNLADVDTETAADKKEIKAEPTSDVYTLMTTKKKEINTRYADEVVCEEVDTLRAEQEIFTKEIEKMIADVEREPTNFVYIQENRNEVEINTSYAGGMKEPENPVLIPKSLTPQMELDRAEAINAELRARVAELEAKLAVYEDSVLTQNSSTQQTALRKAEARIADLEARNAELED